MFMEFAKARTQTRQWDMPFICGAEGEAVAVDPLNDLLEQ